MQREPQIFITESTVITVQQSGRGATAEVTDPASPFNGKRYFGSTPEVAYRCLLRQLEEEQVRA